MMTGRSVADRSLPSRMIRAARAEPQLYEEVERDIDATSQAALVVLIVAIATGIGAIAGAGVGGLIFGVISAFVGWIAWSFVTYWVGTKLLADKENTRATPGELLRALGFAQAPRVLNVVGFIPVLGPLVLLVTSIWSLVLGVIAIRQALDFSTGRAIGTALVSFIPVLIIQFILLAIPRAIF